MLLIMSIASCCLQVSKVAIQSENVKKDMFLAHMINTILHICLFQVIFNLFKKKIINYSSRLSKDIHIIELFKDKRDIFKGSNSNMKLFTYLPSRGYS